jgi:pimeloyl-ACP methyl ester carboxylesterase
MEQGIYGRGRTMGRVLLSSSSIGTILVAALISFTCTGFGPTAEEISAREQGLGVQDEAGTKAEEALSDARRSAGLVRKEIQVDGDRIVYLEGGQGETVLLLHGYQGSKDVWTYFAQRLTPDYHVVIPDLAGFGESTKRLSENYDIDTQVKRFDRFARVLQLQRFHLAGNSMGGTIAAVYAARIPQKISTLALLAPYALQRAKRTDYQWRLENYGENLLLISNPGEFERVAQLCFVKTPPTLGPIKKVVIDQMIADRKFNEKIGWDLFKEALALESFLPMIQVPVLIIWGDHDRILDVSGAPILEKGLKKYQTVILKDTGHMPMWETPAETAAAYMGFLKNKRSAQ